MRSEAAIASAVAMATFSTVLACIVYFRILVGAGATNMLLVTLLVRATSVVLGALSPLERLVGRQLLGFALIALGLAFIDGQLRLLAGKLNNPDFPWGQNREDASGACEAVYPPAGGRRVGRGGDLGRR